MFGPGVFQHAEHFDLKIFDAVTLKDRFADAPHALPDLAQRQQRSLSGGGDGHHHPEGRKEKRAGHDD